MIPGVLPTSPYPTAGGDDRRWTFYLLRFLCCVFVGLHFLKYDHQNQGEDGQIDSDVLGDGFSFIDNPPGILEWIVVADEFKNEASRSVIHEH